MNTNNDWIKVSDRKPSEKDLPVYFYDQKNRDVFPMWVAASLNDLKSANAATHWKGITPPAPPALEPTQAEADTEAFKKQFPTAHYVMVPVMGNSFYVSDVWHAALAYRDAQNRVDLGGVLPEHHEGSSTARKSLERLRRRVGLDA